MKKHRKTQTQQPPIPTPKPKTWLQLNEEKQRIQEHINHLNGLDFSCAQWYAKRDIAVADLQHSIHLIEQKMDARIDHFHLLEVLRAINFCTAPDVPDFIF